MIVWKPLRSVLAGSILLMALPADAAEWFVASGGTGNGTSAAPFGQIQQALNMAQPGDTVTVRPGPISRHSEACAEVWPVNRFACGRAEPAVR
jgi:hypothetical protein